MSEEPEDGGAAFPSCQTSETVEIIYGMSLRDWFAGQALAGYLAMHSDSGVSIPHAETAAMAAYEYADALLAERSKP